MSIRKLTDRCICNSKGGQTFPKGEEMDKTRGAGYNRHSEGNGVDSKNLKDTTQVGLYHRDPSLRQDDAPPRRKESLLHLSAALFPLTLAYGNHKGR